MPARARLHLTAMITTPRLVLASASPRRAELLRAAGFDFDVMPADVDETVRTGEAPAVYVERLARDKAAAVHRRDPGRVVLAADTTVVVDGHILGKPVDVDDARRMLTMLAARTHEVITGVAVAAGNDLESAGETTVVEFAPLSAEWIDWYIATAEPMDKAGAYAIQGFASRFVTRIAGSYSNVVGLPVALVHDMLERLASSGRLRTI